VAGRKNLLGETFCPEGGAYSKEGEKIQIKGSLAPVSNAPGIKYK
jgi:hypothetical protein